MLMKVEKDKSYLKKYELELYGKGLEILAGVDEAGRGPLCGPVVAAAVILPKNSFIEGVDDSKKLSAVTRERLFLEITKSAVAWSVGIADEITIDSINILNATKMAMLDAIKGLVVVPQHVLIDAVRLESLNQLKISSTSIIKGDSLSYTIAAASIIAKVTRDRILEKIDLEYPQYGFKNHKGYGTKEHYEALMKYGPLPVHRKTFIKNLKFEI